jgi:hypothetical protein
VSKYELTLCSFVAINWCVVPTNRDKSKEQNVTRALQKHVARRQDQTFADWFAELRELAGERWADVADQAPTVYAVWGGGATPAQALYMVGLILPPKTAAA